MSSSYTDLCGTAGLVIRGVVAGKGSGHCYIQSTSSDRVLTHKPFSLTHVMGIYNDLFEPILLEWFRMFLVMK